ncbi:hypothetical protein N8525_02830 [Verrucomicrobiales bacterium]|nr:hypothetical protein [Verrucomicrobiales bacterium]MDA7666394.1 hypothetical protein [bacterium]
MKLVVCFGIIAIGLTALLMVFGIFVAGDPDYEGVIRESADAFQANLSEERLRTYLNAPVDGADGYLHLALAGRALGGHQEQFYEISRSPLSIAERRVLLDLAALGEKIDE